MSEFEPELSSNENNQESFDLPQNSASPESETPQSTEPELDFDMTIRGENDYRNRLNPQRAAAEQALVASMDNAFKNAETQPAITSDQAVEAVNAVPQENLSEVITTPEIKYTPEQEKNIEIMEGIIAKYPHSFVERTTTDGRKYFILKSVSKQLILPSLTGNSSDQHNDMLPGMCDYGTGDRTTTLKAHIAISDRGITQYETNRMNRPSELVNELEVSDWTPVFDGGVVMHNGEIFATVKNNNTLKAEGVAIEDYQGQVSNANYDTANLDTLRVLLTEVEQEHKDDDKKNENESTNVVEQEVVNTNESVVKAKTAGEILDSL